MNLRVRLVYLSALVTHLAEEARRRMAAGAYLRRHGIPELSKAEAELVEVAIQREVTAFMRAAVGLSSRCR